MAILVVGASGSTGKLLIAQLLESGQKVKIIVRSKTNIPKNWVNTKQLTIIERSVSEITIEEMSEIIADCQAVASCLGHNPTWKGIYGKPRKLVLDTVKLLCQATIKNNSSTLMKFVLMNTAGNVNKDLNESIPIGQKMVLSLLRLLLPPHPDNEKSAVYLRTTVGQNKRHMEWVIVRPDSLIDEKEVTEYSIYKSPTRSAIFNAGQTSRINVGHFMASLLSNDDLWEKWTGQMPVIYNKPSLN